MEDLDTELLGQLQRWHEEDQYQRIIDAIEAIPQQELRHLYDGEGPQGCFATDRILVDGCRVGYCYKEEPEEGDENWDSGWRFTAGDKSDSYMDDPGRSGIYHLNTLCNYNPDIIPLLDSEPGTAWCRDQSGVFRPELYQPDEE